MISKVDDGILILNMRPPLKQLEVACMGRLPHVSGPR